jgi:hypothetical protein
MQEKITSFLYALLTEGEEFQKFPQDFINEIMKWLHLWLIKNDPVVEAVLVSKGNYVLKAKVLEMKLPALQQNEQFVKELGKRMTDFEGMKNVILKSKVDVKGDASIGDKGKVSDTGNTETKNAIIDGEINVGGNMRIGDNYESNTTIITHTGTGDVVQGGKHITTNNYLGIGGQPPKVDKPGIKAIVGSLIKLGDLEEAIASVIDFSEGKEPKLYSEALQLSGRYHALRGKVNRGIISESQSTTERNQIQYALIDLLGKL